MSSEISVCRCLNLRSAPRLASVTLLLLARCGPYAETGDVSWTAARRWRKILASCVLCFPPGHHHLRGHGSLDAPRQRNPRQFPSMFPVCAPTPTKNLWELTEIWLISKYDRLWWINNRSLAVVEKSFLFCGDVCVAVLSYDVWWVSRMKHKGEFPLSTWKSCCDLLWIYEYGNERTVNRDACVYTQT